MPRFSEPAIEVFTSLFTNFYRDSITDQSIKEQLTTLTDPLDRCFASFNYIRFYFYSQLHEKGLELLKSVEKENNQLQDYFIRFLVIAWNVLYYHGINSPPVDLKKGREYLQELHLVYQEKGAIDEWEKNYIGIWYHLVLTLIETNPDRMLELAELTIKNYDEFSDERFKPDSMAPKIMLGSALTQNLRFYEAKKVFLEILEFLEKNNYQHLFEWTYGQLAQLELLLGNLEEAQKYSEIQEKLSKELKFTFTLRWAFDTQASVKIQQKKFDEAEKLLERSLELRKQDNDEWYIFIGYYAIFMLHYNRYKSSGDKNYLQKSQHIQEALQKQFANTKNERVQNFVEFTQAIINKHGSLAKKGASIQTLNRLDLIYEDRVEIKLHILDLLFEEILITEDQDETIKEIEQTMESLAKSRFRHNPNTIFEFVSQQMILARYNFYIKGIVEESFAIYKNLVDSLEKMKLSFLLETVQNDLKKMESELNEWNTTITSNKNLVERITKSKFSDYIEDAMKIVSKNR